MKAGGKDRTVPAQPQEGAERSRFSKIGVSGGWEWGEVMFRWFGSLKVTLTQPGSRLHRLGKIPPHDTIRARALPQAPEDKRVGAGGSRLGLC